MRTATTIAKLHENGAWVMLSGPDVPLVKQHAEFRAMAGKPNDEYAECRYQEEDGPALVHRLKTVAQTRALDEQRQEQSRIMIAKTHPPQPVIVVAPVAIVSSPKINQPQLSTKRK